MTRPLRLYLAGASLELSRVLPMVERLERSGLVVLHSRWWDAVQAHGVGNDHTLTREQQAAYADADLEGVRDAELVWVLWPEARSVGAALEYGYALASCIHTVVTGPTAHECIFTAKANYRDADDWAGLHEVLRVAAERKLPETLPAPPDAGHDTATCDCGDCENVRAAEASHEQGTHTMSGHEAWAAMQAGATVEDTNTGTVMLRRIREGFVECNTPDGSRFGWDVRPDYNASHFEEPRGYRIVSEATHD